MRGYGGDDLLIGGGGDDVLKGAGTDTFADFDVAGDVIEITGGARSLADLDITRSGDDATIRFAQAEILVNDITVGALHDGDLFPFT